LFLFGNTVLKGLLTDKVKNMKPFIHNTSFGSISVDHFTFHYDVLIRANGHIEKRKKKLSKKVHGTSHTLSLDEAEFICEEGISKIIIGCGQNGVLELSDEAKNHFRKKQVSLVLADTPHAIREYNNEKEPCVGLFHITC
jgi:hypothetical protein